MRKGRPQNCIKQKSRIIQVLGPIEQTIHQKVFPNSSNFCLIIFILKKKSSSSRLQCVYLCYSIPRKHKSRYLITMRSVRNNSFSESVRSADEQSSRASSRSNSIASISSLDSHQQDLMLLKLVKSLSKEAKADLAAQAAYHVKKHTMERRRFSHQGTVRPDQPLFEAAEAAASSRRATPRKSL